MRLIGILLALVASAAGAAEYDAKGWLQPLEDAERSLRKCIVKQARELKGYCPPIYETEPEYICELP